MTVQKKIAVECYINKIINNSDLDSIDTIVVDLLNKFSVQQLQDYIVDIYIKRKHELLNLDLKLDYVSSYKQKQINKYECTLHEYAL